MPHICRSLTLRLRRQTHTNSLSTANTRAFSQNPRCSQVEIPPESPRYVEIPQSAQPQIVLPKRVRGIIPVPRDIFSINHGQVTRQADEVAKADRRQRSTTNPKHAAHNEWRTRMAKKRVENLQTAVQHLRQRQVTARRVREEGTAAYQVERRTARTRNQELREQANLTVPTMSHLLTRGPIPDPNREERIKAMQKRIGARQALREAQQTRALHTLYMNARDFIVTEKQLDDKIETEFGTQENPRTWGLDGPSVWHQDVPESLKDMLQRTGGGRGAADDKEGTTKLMKNRMRRVAEELTGGKL